MGSKFPGTPLELISKVDLSGSLSDGGWTFTLTANQEGFRYNPDREIRAIVRDNFGGTWDPWEYLFKGFIETPTTNLRWELAENTVTAYTIHRHLREGWLRATGFVEATSNLNSHRVAPGTLTSDYVIRHLLVEHTNLPRVSTFEVDVGGFSYADITFQDSKFWEALEYLAKAEMRIMYVDRNNVFHFKAHPALLDPPLGGVMTFDDTLLMDGTSFTQVPRRVAQVQCFGFTNELVEIASFYPPTSQRSIGDVIEYPSLRVNSQAELDTLAYRLFQWENRQWSGRLKVALNHEIELGDIVAVDYTDTVNTINFSGSTFFVTSINYSVDIEKNVWTGEIGVEIVPDLT